MKPIKPIVALSCGPYGSTLSDGSEFTGKLEVTRSELAKFHVDKLHALLYFNAQAHNPADFIKVAHMFMLQCIRGNDFAWWVWTLLGRLWTSL